MTTMLAPPTWRYVLELVTDAGTIHPVPLARADFARAAEAVFFAALRAGRVTEYAPSLHLARVCPHAPGFEVELPLAEGAPARGRFGLDYFKTFARRHGARLALQGALPADAAVSYRLAALPDEEVLPARQGLSIALEEETTIPIREGRLPRTALAMPDFPVLLPRHVLEDAVADARQAPEREVGGVLLGHLRREGETGELYLEVTCSVPCEGTESTALSVTFTHQTWARVREVVALRGEGELIVGWVHSHPFRLCAECPRPVPMECRDKVLFYSTDDEFLMETAFARPFMIGLLTAVEPRLGELPVKLFGWRDGVIVPRGFEVIEL